MAIGQEKDGWNIELKGKGNSIVNGKISTYLKKLGVDLKSIQYPTEEPLDISRFHPTIRNYIIKLEEITDNDIINNLKMNSDGSKFIFDEINLDVIINLHEVFDDKLIDFIDLSKPIHINARHARLTKKTAMFIKDLENITKVDIINMVNDYYFINMDLINFDDYYIPDEIKGTFNCASNQLTSLKGVPQKVHGEFDCANNQLTTLKDAPTYIKKNFDCSYNKLTSLKYSIDYIEGWFNCGNNQLTSLKYAPIVGKSFFCHKNKLTTLDGAPKEVDVTFWCSDNRLTSLKYAPEYVGVDFICSGNPLTSLEGIPKTIGGNFTIDKKCGFTEEYIRSLSDIKGIVIFK
jgi:hypothetical protein